MLAGRAWRAMIRIKAGIMPAMHTTRSSRWAGWASVGLVWFVLAVVVSQIRRPDLDWIRVPLSFYLLGPGGIALRVAYVVMAVALVLLGVSGWLAATPSRRRIVPAGLFMFAAVALCVVAFAETNTREHPDTLHGLVHGVAAQATFLGVTVAMMLQAWWLRADPAWRGRMRGALPWAAVCFIALWVQALDRDLPRGLGQKVLVVMIVSWLLVFAWRLRRGPAPGQARRQYP